MSRRRFGRKTHAPQPPETRHIYVRNPFRDAMNASLFRGRAPLVLAEDFKIAVRYTDDNPDGEEREKVTHTPVPYVYDSAEPGRVTVVRAPPEGATFPARSVLTRLSREAARNAPRAPKFVQVEATGELLPDGRYRLTWLNGAGVATLVSGPLADKVIKKLVRGES